MSPLTKTTAAHQNGGPRRPGGRSKPQPSFGRRSEAEAASKPSNLIATSPSTISAQEMWEKYVSKRIPLLLQGPLDDPGYDLSKLADLDFLRSQAGHVKVKVEPFNRLSGTFGTALKRKEMSFGGFLDHLDSTGAAEAQGQGQWYLTTQYEDEDEDDGEDEDEDDDDDDEPILEKVLPSPTDALSNHFPYKPRILGDLVLQQCNLWLGDSKNGKSSGLHHDFHDNLYILLSGRKRFLLFPPESHRFLHPRGEVEKVHSNGLIVYKPRNNSNAGFPPAHAPKLSIRPDGLVPSDAARWRRKARLRLLQEVDERAAAQSGEGGKRKHQRKGKAKQTRQQEFAQESLLQAEAELLLCKMDEQGIDPLVDSDEQDSQGESDEDEDEEDEDEEEEEESQSGDSSSSEARERDERLDDFLSTFPKEMKPIIRKAQKGDAQALDELNRFIASREAVLIEDEDDDDDMEDQDDGDEEGEEEGPLSKVSAAKRGPKRRKVEKEEDMEEGSEDEDQSHSGGDDDDEKEEEEEGWMMFDEIEREKRRKEDEEEDGSSGEEDDDDEGDDDDDDEDEDGPTFAEEKEEEEEENMDSSSSSPSSSDDDDGEPLFGEADGMQLEPEDSEDEKLLAMLASRTAKSSAGNRRQRQRQAGTDPDFTNFDSEEDDDEENDVDDYDFEDEEDDDDDDDEPLSFSLIKPKVLHKHFGVQDDPSKPCSRGGDKEEEEVGRMSAKQRKRILMEREAENNGDGQDEDQDDLRPLPGCPEPIEVFLRPGQMLYLPASWYHEVTSYTSPAEEEEEVEEVEAERADSKKKPRFHMALNYWMHPPDALEFKPCSSSSGGASASAGSCEGSGKVKKAEGKGRAEEEEDCEDEDEQGDAWWQVEVEMGESAFKNLRGGTGSVDRPYRDAEVWDEIERSVREEVKKARRSQDQARVDDQQEESKENGGSKRKKKTLDESSGHSASPEPREGERGGDGGQENLTEVRIGKREKNKVKKRKTAG